MNHAAKGEKVKGLLSKFCFSDPCEEYALEYALDYVSFKNIFGHSSQTGPDLEKPNGTCKP